MTTEYFLPGVRWIVQAYNQKIIETPTYIEIWKYEKPITKIQPKSKTDKKKTNKKLDWLYENENELKREFDDLTALEQYDSLKRKQKHYRNMRFEIARLIDTNFDDKTKFLTLTFKDNLQDIDYPNNEFRKFIKRLNCHLYKNKKSQISYLATWEKQKRGAVHYHIILFDFPFIPHDKLAKIWGHGLVWINKIDVDSVENRGRYLSKYFDKDLEMKEHKKKAFFKSQNLKLPKETKKLTSIPCDLENQEILYTKDYLRKSPVFYLELNETGFMEQSMEFEESNVRYAKIKKHQY